LESIPELLKRLQNTGSSQTHLLNIGAKEAIDGIPSQALVKLSLLRHVYFKKRQQD
jgi:hypothetical protein